MIFPWKTRAFGALTAAIVSSFFSQASLSAESLKPGPSIKIVELEKRYGSKIHFASAEAENSVFSFDIDCHAPDGRYVPLINILVARVAENQRKEAWQETTVIKRGSETRVYDQVKRADGRAFDPMLAMEINQWGELRMIGMSNEAALNTCVTGPYGRLWQIPSKT